MSFNVESYFSDVSNGNPILHFKGNIDSDLINKVLDTVEGKLISVKEHSKLRKKVYNVLVESLQNLYHHADKVPPDFEDTTSERFGILSVNKVENGYKIITGNFIRTADVARLDERIRKINSSSHEEITELYKFILNHQRITLKGGGGLGLVDMARKTGNKFDYLFKEYDELNTFFYLNVLVSEIN